MRLEAMEDAPGTPPGADTMARAGGNVSGPPSPVDGAASHIAADLGEAGLDGADGLAPGAGQPAQEPAAGAGGPAGAAPPLVSSALLLPARRSASAQPQRPGACRLAGQVQNVLGPLCTANILRWARQAKPSPAAACMQCKALTEICMQ